ncbi:MAG: NAD(P)(+) transhydrogenase (Re/Si-specific) subunit beta [Oenococcus sp.]|uniref:NAD(P)(+) transhydrogenase (Re/Si-specific) subunit beta n=1 Tax=Oenococcus TaxID=46254 RepID=UPI0021E96896|nr:NAD(P)(+) transhydrogenase (Re/Si-specific) subunit beta [Oenococcus kitaharae]MCV3296912.1 NAD(P)(+) transhydrogenase (Re/Si-specific) subunit beta [Oenococcus kitaharae]
MTGLTTTASLIYLISAFCYVIGVHLMRSPKTAKKGNGLSFVGMILAAIMILIEILVSGRVQVGAWIALAAGLALGIFYGFSKAKRVPMTDVPQLVSLFNAVGGGAAAAIGAFDYMTANGHLPLVLSIPVVLDIVIGGITFSGSLIATGKLSGKVSGKPITFPGSKFVNILVVIAIVAAAILMITQVDNSWYLVLALLASLAFGLLMTLPIGGADMPVVVSLLNAFTGLAVAFAGFVINNQVLIIAGALVGAAGTILTLQMADAMNRSVANILAGGFGTDDSQPASPAGQTDVKVVETSADDIGLQLAYAHNVMIVPGYGLAAAQAQHEVAELAKLLTDNGINVDYAIHPVAGRMPGHMNVLLADVNVPYDQLKQLDEANSMFENTDVSLVIGANDVTNPLARESGNDISGMPILDVDKSKSVVVIKRSMSSGYAGVPNPLFSLPNTKMFFSDAKKGLQDIIASSKEYINQ